MLKQILDHNVRVYVIATGAGAGFQKALWDIPGASSFLVGAEFPYKSEKTIERLGFTPEQFVSEETSIELAMKAYMEAYDPKESPDNVIGIGLTASVASVKAHRGEHRVFVSVVSNTDVFTISACLQKGEGEQAREQDGLIADDLAQVALLEALKIKSAFSSLTTQNYLWLKSDYHDNEKLINLIMKRPYLKADGTRSEWQTPVEHMDYYDNADNKQVATKPSSLVIFYPGTFNPLHYGHVAAAEAARESRIHDMEGFNVDLIYTTCINPLHKSQAAAVDLLQKISQMKGKNFLLTKDDGLFLDKARAFPSAGFVLGADALLNMMNRKWYKNSNDVEDMMEELADLDVMFYIVGRLVGDKFTTLADIEREYPIVGSYSFLFSAVPGRWDVSSTELRNSKNAV